MGINSDSTDSFRINKILADWNPIEVPAEIAQEEYTPYIEEILSSAINEKTLYNCLVNILIDKIGLDYDSNNKEQVKELKDVCLRILNRGGD